MGNVIVGLILLLVVVLCVRSIIREHRQGGCGGGSCSGNCGSCGGCSNQDIIITVKRKYMDK
ncbi:MAG: FeoB-associated Cys-rich membrane protein [Lachnospiraceae bacterium]|nr:FeoB-associated Cys-rich membrane protein [Lachnospiraceae bacterium]